MQTISLPAGSRARVMPFATILESQKIGLPREERAARRGDEAGAEHEVAGDLDHAAGMDDAHGDAGLVRREARKVGFAADDGEGAPIDLGAVAGVIVFGAHGRCPLADWSKASI